jgi:hypothetical protein
VKLESRREIDIDESRVWSSHLQLPLPIFSATANLTFTQFHLPYECALPTSPSQRLSTALTHLCGKLVLSLLTSPLFRRRDMDSIGTFVSALEVYT